MRKYYIDNIRNLGILLLFPFHTCMIYNGFESFYVHGNVVKGCDNFILITGIWFMPLLFLLAGISSFYALQKRSKEKYLKERFHKLLVPAFWGILLLVPIQTYYAEKFHNNYKGGFLNQYVLFFTKPTDLTGYTGGFTPAHLWFLLYLFVIAVLALPLMIKLINPNNRVINWFNKPINVVLLFIIPFLASGILDIGGKSLGAFFSFVLIGFLLCKQDKIFDMLERYRQLYLTISLLLTAVLYKIYYAYGWKAGLSAEAIAFSAFRHLLMWVSILTILGYGKKYLNFCNKLTNYFTKAAFPVYVFHQNWLIVIGYYILRATNVFILQFSSIILISFAASILTYEIFRRIPITRFMFGIKK